MSPSPPVRANGAPRLGSRPSLVDIKEEVAPDAFHSYRPGEANAAPTVPPPRPMPMPPPRGFEGPRKPVVPLVPLPKAAPDWEREPTLIGVAPPSLAPPRDKLDSLEISTDAILGELAAEHKRRKVAELELSRLKAPVISIAPSKGPTEEQLRKAAIHAVLLKLGGALVVLVTAGGAYLSARANTIAPQVDRLDEKSKVQKLTTDDLSPRVLKLENYIRAKRKRDECVDEQLRSALSRATGHAVTSLPESSTHWASESLPPARVPMLWQHDVWFPVGRCPDEPELP